jgi:hypothetical protein
VAQYYHDNRLNHIEEGAQAIHGIGILCRKALLNKGVGLRLLNDDVVATLAEAAD